MTQPGAPVLVAALVFALAGGCGGSGGNTLPATSEARLVDSREVESVVVATQRRSGPDLSVGPASCPAGVPATEGATFECTVTVEGVAAPYLVTVHRTDTGRGLSYDVRPAKAILLVPRVVEAIRSAVSSAGESPAVDCGPARVRVAEVGSTFDCSLTVPEGSRTVRVQVETVDGNVSFRET